MLEEIRSLNFSHAEISHGLRYSKWPGIKEAVAQGVIKISSLHNYCPQPVEFLNTSPNYVQFTDERLSLRQAAVRHTLITIENAVSLGAQFVVLHLGWAGPGNSSRKLYQLVRQGKIYSRAFVKQKIRAVSQRNLLTQTIFGRVRDCLEKVVETATLNKIKLGFEIRESFDEFPNEVEMQQLLKDFPSETVGYWHDFGHAAHKDFLTWHNHLETLQSCRSRLIGCHVHDFRAPDEDHLPLGKGNLDFPALLKQLPMDYLPVLEVRPETTTEEIIESKKLWDSYVNI